MPSYFYHIYLELLSSQATHLDEKATSEDQKTRQLYNGALEAFYPFQKYPKIPRKHPRNTQTETARSKSSQSLAISAGGAKANTDQCLHQAYPPEVKAPHTTTTSSLHSARQSKDLRLDQISIESIDMVSPDVVQRRKHEDNHISKGIGTDIGGLATKGRYTPLDQKWSESAWGIVHLYRDAQETPSLYEDILPPKSSRSRHDGLGNNHTVEHGPVSDHDCTMLSVLAVPSYLSPSDFLGFVGEETRDEVSHFRMIRTARANRYMVLMKFRNGKKAREWQRQWNGKVFNTMEPETCHVVFVKSVEIQPSTTGGESTTFPGMKDDPFTPSISTTDLPSTRGSTTSTAQSISLAPAPLSSKPLAPPTPALVELPTCPVCLERMDETTGLLTILCQHVFHCTCLQKWRGSGCPVCRYTQDDFGRRGQLLDEKCGEKECSVCRAEKNLWICLICGNIGCGRYDGAHAFAHYEQTSHCFALDLSEERVWDYESDGYVHRIIQNKPDGKLVELPAADHSALDPPDWADSVPREKLENISLEYTHLLTSQLESQRTYFEEKVERAADKASEASAAALSATEAASKASAQLVQLQKAYDDLARDAVPALEREKSRIERKAEKFETMARKMEKELREEKAMNGSLMEKIQFLTNEVSELKATNGDLEEQNRDLSFFISGSEKLKGQGEDIQEGVVSVPDPPTAKKKGKGRR